MYGAAQSSVSQDIPTAILHEEEVLQKLSNSRK